MLSRSVTPAAAAPGEAQAPRRPPLPWAAAVIGLLGTLGLELVIWSQFIASRGAWLGYLAWTDFVTWFAAARVEAAGQGARLFDGTTVIAAEAGLIAPYHQVDGGILYQYWPVLGALLVPLAGWPLLPAYIAWVLLGAAAFTVALLALMRELRFGWLRGLLFGLAAWTFYPHIFDLSQGQTSNLLCLPLALGLLALRRGSDFRAGILLGMLFLKPQFAILWVVGLLAGRRWRALAGGGVTLLVLLAISTALAGPGWLGGWLALSRDVLGATTGHGIDLALSHNFRQLIGLIPGLGPDGAVLVQGGLAVALAIGIAWLWWGTAADGTPHGDGLLALTILAMLLTTPLLLTHDLTFWVVAGAFLLVPQGAGAPGRSARLWPLLAWIGWLVPWPAILTQLDTPFKLAGCYMLLLCGLLVRQVVRPRPAQRARAAAL